MTKCECIFCSSRCPECGSTEIEIEFNVKWRYENDSDNTIMLTSGDTGLDVTCNECGDSFSYDDLYTLHKQDDRLQPLYAALCKQLDLGNRIIRSSEERDENGNFEQNTKVSRSVNQTHT